MAIFLRKGWHLFNARNKQQSYPNQSTSLGQNCPPTHVWTEPKVHTQTHFLTAAKSKSASGCNFSCHCSTQNRFISRASRAKKTFLHFLFLNYFNNVYLPTYLPIYLERTILNVSDEPSLFLHFWCCDFCLTFP